MMNSTKTSKLLTTRTLTVIAMMSAVATILMLYEIPLWFAPNFYKLDFSEVPVLVGAFAMGPIAGILIELVKVLLNLAFNGTITMGVGEFANFLIGCSLVVPAAIIYNRKKSIKTAMQGLIVGTISMTIVGSVLNAVLLLPIYAFFMNASMSDLVSFGSSVNPAIKNLTTFILLAVAPFNLLKGVVVSLVTMLLYKKISVVIKAFTK
jgi:riboflavin transporter FmnP